MIAKRTEEFHYRVSWRSDSVRPGFHPSRRSGSGERFRGLAPLLKHPDPRRIDLRASMLDPFGGYAVRIYEQRSAIKVFAIVDLSASMEFRGAGYKMETLSDFLGSLALSAYRTGDALGIIGCSDKIHAEFSLPLCRHPAMALNLVKRLRRFRPKGTNARGLAEAARCLPTSRALVFLASDFHMPLTLVKRILISLGPHDVVPLVFWDANEMGGDAVLGFRRMRDLENGSEQLLLLRPKLRARLEESYRDRRERLVHLFLSHGRKPLFLGKEFKAEYLTRYFQRSL
ncbi:DUF58 domain-containing protein [Methylocaldum sp. MU1018]